VGKKVYLNGKFISQKEASLSIFDRGLLYGDGVFESLRTYDGRPFLLEEHIKRLLKALKILRIKSPMSAKKLKLAVLKTLAINKLKESYLKIIVTRGVASEHGLADSLALGKTNLIIIVQEQRPYHKKIFERGWKSIISSIKKPDVPTAKIKSLCYLDNILAKMEARKAGAEEAILLDEAGNLAEGTISNIFIVKFGTIYTPPKEAPILAGITRERVIKLAKQAAFKVIEKTITPKELYTADECFVTLSGPGVVPITKIWQKKIGSGQCGYTTASLIKLYNDETKRNKI